MHRRALLKQLGTVGIVSVAGCTSSADTPKTSTETPLCEDEGTSPNTSSSTTTSPAESYTELTIDSSTMHTIDSDLHEGAAVDATITNTGTAPTELFEVTVDWLNSNGDAIDSTGEFMNLLEGGETWRARITADTVDSSKIADYDIFVPSVNLPSSTVNPDGITVVSTSVTAGDDEYVRGEIKNERASTVEYLEAVGKVYDAGGRVLTSGSDIQESLRAGATWRTQMDLFSHGRSDQIADGRVLPLL